MNKDIKLNRDELIKLAAHYNHRADDAGKIAREYHKNRKYQNAQRMWGKQEALADAARMIGDLAQGITYPGINGPELKDMGLNKF